MAWYDLVRNGEDKFSIFLSTWQGSVWHDMVRPVKARNARQGRAGRKSCSLTFDA